MPPTTTTSRRRPRIEDDEADQEDQQPVRQSQRRSGRATAWPSEASATADSEAAAPNRTHANVRGRTRGGDNDDDEQEEEGHAARPSRGMVAYKPQPLDKGAAAMIKQSMAAYGPHEDFIRQAMGFLEEATTVAAEVEESIDNDTFFKFDADFKEMIDAQVECATRKAALDQIRRRLDEGEEIHDASKEYNQLVRKELDAYRASTTRQKYGQNKEYISFRESIWAAVEDSAMPPINEFLPKEQGDGEDSDDDIQVGGTRQDYKCPYSAKILFDPISSTECTHSYDRESILDYIGNGEKTCPATGCSVKLSKRKLKVDPKLAKRVAAFQRREESRTMSNQTRTQILD